MTNLSKWVFVKFQLIWLAFILSGCNEEYVKEPVVVSESQLFVSGERVRLSGRLVSTQSHNVTDHGFIISLESSFANMVTISLGQRNNPGRFIGETSGLLTGHIYYWKPFVNIDGRLLEGEIKTFTTLLPEIFSVTPLLSSEGQLMHIYGRNFTSDIVIYFDNIQAQVIDIEKESIIQLRIPPIGNSQFPTIKVISQGNQIIVNQQFEYIIGKWEFLENFFIPNIFIQNVSITNNDDFYFGLGFSGVQSFPKLLKLNVPQWIWTETSYTTPVLISAFSGPGFFGSGRDIGSGLSSSFYVLDNANFVSKAPVPVPLTNSVAAKVDNAIYVFGGKDVNRATNRNNYKYLISEDRWITLGSSPIDIDSKYPRFVHNTFIYFITPDALMHRFDTETQTWDIVSSYPANSVANGNGISEVIGDKAYIGLFDSDRTVWEYDILANSWKPKKGFSGENLFNSTATSFVHNNGIYVFKNPKDNNGGKMSIWKFIPNAF